MIKLRVEIHEAKRSFRGPLVDINDIPILFAFVHFLAVSIVFFFWGGGFLYVIQFR